MRRVFKGVRGSPKSVSLTEWEKCSKMEIDKKQTQKDRKQPIKNTKTKNKIKTSQKQYKTNE